MDVVWTWLESTALAAAVGQSPALTATLSSVHVIGFTLITGGALVGNLRLLRWLLPDRPVLEIARPAGRGILVGLAISLTTGLLLFAPRAAEASGNSIFQWKMLFLAGAAAFHLGVHGPASRRPMASPRVLQLVGAVGLLLWFGVALAGAAFILLEGT